MGNCRLVIRDGREKRLERNRNCYSLTLMLIPILKVVRNEDSAIDMSSLKINITLNLLSKTKYQNCRSCSFGKLIILQSEITFKRLVNLI